MLPWGKLSFFCLIQNPCGSAWKQQFQVWHSLKPLRNLEICFLCDKLRAVGWGHCDWPYTCHWWHKCSMEFPFTVFSTSFGKTFFSWHFILNENVLFWLTKSCLELFVFSVSLLFFSNIYFKIHFTTKKGPDLCRFYRKLDFFFFY